VFLPGFDDHRHEISTASADLSYIDVGMGPPALFVHGILTNAYVWQNLIGRLTDLRRCVAVDLPLHGSSPARPDQRMTIGAFADVIAEACDRLGLDQVDLVAHDTGGAIAQVFAARHPERLRTLTLTNCETQDNVPPAAMAATVDLARNGQLVSSAPALMADRDARAALFATGYRNPEFLTRELIDSFLEPVLGTATAAEKFQQLIAMLGPGDLIEAEPGLGKLDAPTLIAWATDDLFFDRKWAHWLHDTIPGAREVVEFPGAKLFFPHEQADELAPHIRAHWIG
jgi:pimeloyl-ACP methyl ester carboxylesterase